MKIKTVIVDDEPLARERIRTLLSLDNDFHVVGESENGNDALKKITESEIDVVFLDIQMPELDGMRLAEKIPEEKMPLIVFVTAFDAFAVKAFEVQAIDYLLKPFNKKRFGESLRRIKEHFLSEDKDLYVSQVINTVRSVAEKKTYPERIVVKTEGRIRFIPAREIFWIESEANYLRIHLESEKPLIRETMANFILKLDPAVFIRVHRSIIVNAALVVEMKQWSNDEHILLLKNKTQLPIGRSFRKKVNDFFRL